MRQYLIERIHDLEQRTEIFALEDFSKWSNKELLDYFGNLCVELHYEEIINGESSGSSGGIGDGDGTD